jgi:hypothetical protein
MLTQEWPESRSILHQVAEIFIVTPLSGIAEEPSCLELIGD